MYAIGIGALMMTMAGLAADPAVAQAVDHSAGLKDKFHITAEERTACGQDAADLCSAAYPDEDKLLACMKVNRLSLSAACRPVFEDGIRRRHLN